MITFAIGPRLIADASDEPWPTGARTTAVTSPMRAPAVANSAFVFVAFVPTKSARINTVLISTSFLLGMKPVVRRRIHHL